MEDLSAYEDGTFDLVMSFDAPISYTYPNQEKTIKELVRIAKKRIIISVSSRLGSLPYLAKSTTEKPVYPGPGAFARTIPNEILVKIMNDPKQREDFLEFCHMYDSNPYVCGMGKDNLFARGEIGN